MAPSFSSLPIVDVSMLSQTIPSPVSLAVLSQQLYDAFSATGFAYLINAPLRFGHEEVFGLASDFFSIEHAEKMKLAKKTFANRNGNTYRGYFPQQAGQQDNLKEGFEIGPPEPPQQTADSRHLRVDLGEANVWPEDARFAGRRKQFEKLHQELQALSATLLSLLAVALKKPADYFESDEVKLCCMPHTDSGILTLLHQDETGGLEVLNADGKWIAAPYVPGSIVVNIGDLLAEVSDGQFVATMHRVRTNTGERTNGAGRLSIPFFFEPGEKCVVRSMDGERAVVYGEHIRRKMATWVEYEDLPDIAQVEVVANGIPIEAH
ncbi:hypothetical protein LTR85_010225 [Meristemomyces frigidus]|nr:hypothetical protein LTR85_010225 [Meristemomyces frigidus]